MHVMGRALVKLRIKCGPHANRRQTVHQRTKTDDASIGDLVFHLQRQLERTAIVTQMDVILVKPIRAYPTPLGLGDVNPRAQRLRNNLENCAVTTSAVRPLRFANLPW